MSNADFFPIERNRYFYGKLLTVRDFALEQQYHCNKLQLLNRLHLGAGVVCGLGVAKVDDTTLLIESGMALDYQGRMILQEEPILRKLQMLEGQENLLGKNTGYLCLSYAETDVEPVNAVGADTGESRQFNMTRESCRIFLTAEAPDYKSLLEVSGNRNVSVLYSTEALTVVLSAPSYVCSGQTFDVQLLFIKGEKTPPVYLQLEGSCSFVESESGRIHLEFQESTEEKRRVYSVSFPLKARQLRDIDSQLFPSGGELDVALGSHHYKNYLEIVTKIHLCGTQAELENCMRMEDNLEKRLSGQDIPIYLAKLELINSAGSVFLSDITNLPFNQSLSQATNAARTGGAPRTVTTSVRALEYWQKPDVKAIYQGSSGALHFDFGIPSPEQYDYAIAHGTVSLTLPGGIRVNSRVFSEEIAHGLGPGAVDVRLSVEFEDQTENGETALLYGNSEVFKGKHTPSTPIWADVAAVVYPERGSMRIGLWLHDSVDGNRVTIHYFVQKPERDTSRILASRPVSIHITPEFSRVACREKKQFEAEIVGSADTSVRWQVREENGGSIDRNGIYQAPEIAGTYEIVATAGADETAIASAMVIVE